METQRKNFTLKQMLSTKLQQCIKDPILAQKYPIFFSVKDQTNHDLSPKSPSDIPKSARIYLHKTRLPSTHHLEQKYNAYLKASKIIKFQSNSKKQIKKFDLAEYKLQEFKNDESSLIHLIRSESAVRASRLVMKPSKLMLETTEKIKKHSSEIFKSKSKFSLNRSQTPKKSKKINFFVKSPTERSSSTKSRRPVFTKDNKNNEQLI